MQIHEFRDMDGDLWDYDGAPPNPHPDDDEDPDIGVEAGENAERFVTGFNWVFLWWYYLPKRYFSVTLNDKT
ncbi:hypothetical protein ACFQAS_15365 [Halopenitus salinus]|uniref:hypothetical protein n=1 Tax=Halopenitus salinus TaxID=1198295 RepID=UPI00361F77F5